MNNTFITDWNNKSSYERQYLLEKYHGMLVSNDFINYIVDNLYFSSHSVDMMRKRTSCVNLIVNDNNNRLDYSKIKEKLRNSVSKPVLAYVNTDGSINVAITEYDYFVFAYNPQYDNWTLITFKEKSWYDKNIFEKRKMALDGFDRKY